MSDSDILLIMMMAGIALGILYIVLLLLDSKRDRKSITDKLTQQINQCTVINTTTLLK